MDSITKHCSNWAVGKNQSIKAIRSGQASLVYLAYDADSSLVSFINEICEQYSVHCDNTHSLHQLGAACGIEVGCAVCTLMQATEDEKN